MMGCSRIVLFHRNSIDYSTELIIIKLKEYYLQMDNMQIWHTCNIQGSIGLGYSRVRNITTKNVNGYLLFIIPNCPLIYNIHLSSTPS